MPYCANALHSFSHNIAGKLTSRKSHSESLGNLIKSRMWMRSNINIGNYSCLKCQYSFHCTTPEPILRGAYTRSLHSGGLLWLSMDSDSAFLWSKGITGENIQDNIPTNVCTLHSLIHTSVAQDPRCLYPNISGPTESRLWHVSGPKVGPACGGSGNLSSLWSLEGLDETGLGEEEMGFQH